MGNFITDHELQGPPNLLISSLMNTNLIPPPPSSPVQTRRDSILKHQGSVKTDKRVSIKQTPTTSANNNGKLSSSNIEYVSEKANDASMIASNSRKRQGKTPSGPRPASLVITKNEGNSQFKLVRSSSIDYDDMESQQHTTTIQRPINRTTLLEQLQEDESAPLVFTVHK
ncbi:hypothetical protein DOY81_015071 [Sarcophaga bullata]|nr:hypothetical protein DOY81_015071 [Sarcophaga bullata]